MVVEGQKMGWERGVTSIVLETVSSRLNYQRLKLLYKGSNGFYNFPFLQTCSIIKETMIKATEPCHLSTLTIKSIKSYWIITTWHQKLK